MLFNSFEFLLFLPSVVILYFLLPFRFRWVLLLGASYFFYMCWKPGYALLLFASTAVNYLAGYKIHSAPTGASKKVILWGAVALNLGLLSYFKYMDFFASTLNSVLIFTGSTTHISPFDIVLPVGVSFFTFQSMSYMLDIYHGKRGPEGHFGMFALYVSFFPQLVAGPVERSTSLLPQFFRKHDFDMDRLADGLKLILWGFFKKLVIADRLALFVNEVYGTSGDIASTPLILATYFFAFQIYCDFSAYSDIAIGSARIMGYELMDNFNRPYFAKSVPDFWRRWHISLTSWFREYLYLPLGGNRVSRWIWGRNVGIVFFLSGLWHGAAWHFVVWGLLHGAYIVVSIQTEGVRERVVEVTGLARFPKVRRMLQAVITFHLVTFAWIFFRAESLTKAISIVENIFTPSVVGLADIFSSPGGVDVIIGIVAIIFMELIHLIQGHGGMRHMLMDRPIVLRWALLYILIFATLIFGKFTAEEFIYFQF